jgi:hypothetical protein
MKYADKSCYDGQYKMDKRHGTGTYTYVNGDAYAGGWANGVKHGKGCYFFAANKCQFLGYWEGAKFTAGTVRPFSNRTGSNWAGVAVADWCRLCCATVGVQRRHHVRRLFRGRTHWSRHLRLPERHRHGA